MFELTKPDQHCELIKVVLEGQNHADVRRQLGTDHLGLDHAPLGSFLRQQGADI